MLIAIPSLSRAETYARNTLRRIPLSQMKRTIMFVHKSQKDDYKRHMPAEYAEAGLKVVADDSRGIAAVRHSIGKYAKDKGEKKFVMMDDDLTLLIRRDAKRYNLRYQVPDEDTDEMFDYIEDLLDDYAHGALSPREGNNRPGPGTRKQLELENTRAMRVLFFRTDEFLSVEHERVRIAEDFDVTLQLLRAGYKNVVPYWYANGQGKTQAAGGCSVYRTHEVHAEAMERLADLHPGLVRLRQKHNKTDADGFGTRVEATISWQKAYQSSVPEAD